MECENEKEVLDDLCLPYLYMPIYKAENGKFWADEEQISSSDMSYFSPEEKHSLFYAVLRFHPLPQHDVSVIGCEG